MTIDDYKWLGGIMLPAIPLNITLINFYLNDKIKQPLRLTALANISYAVIGAVLGFYVTKELIVSAIVFVECGILSSIIFYILKQRDLKGIKFGEEMVQANLLLDYQILYVLSALIDKKSSSELKGAIINGLNYTLYQISEILGLNKKTQKQEYYSLSILLAKRNGRFQVLSHQGISPIQTEQIEKKFRHKPNVVSVAGYAVNKGEIVCLCDLSDTSKDAAKNWIETENNEKQEGFLMCYPLLVKTNKNGSLTPPEAVLCLSSKKANAFDCDAAKEVLGHFAPKIEALITIYNSQ